jgi:hypothetical protein
MDDDLLLPTLLVNSNDNLSTDAELVEEENELDTDWMEEEKRIQNIQTVHVREPMSSITLFYIYINQYQYIDKIISEKHVISDPSSVLSKETLLQIIQTRKISKYKFVDILTFHVPLEPEHLQYYSKQQDFQESSKGFFKVLPIVDEIRIEPSIFIFHNINSIFFIFQEFPQSSQKHTLKSILKKENLPLLHKTTKKVRIELPHEKRTPAFSSRTTRKNLVVSPK